MELAVDPLELGFVHVRVDLCGGYVRVAEKFLDDPKISPAGEQMSRETVAQGVRRSLRTCGPAATC